MLGHEKHSTVVGLGGRDGVGRVLLSGSAELGGREGAGWRGLGRTGVWGEASCALGGPRWVGGGGPVAAACRQALS